MIRYAVGGLWSITPARAIWLEREFGETPRRVLVSCCGVSGKPRYAAKLVTGAIRDGALLIDIHVTGLTPAIEDAVLRLARERLHLAGSLESAIDLHGDVEANAILSWGPPIPARDAVLEVAKWLSLRPIRAGEYQHRMMRARDVA